MSNRPEHVPRGNPCELCKRPASEHRSRASHPSMGDPCEVCGMPARAHRGKRTQFWRDRERERERERPKGQDRIIGIDGEGQGSRPHLYTYMAASDEDGHTWEVYNPQGLKTHQCFDLMLELPRRALVVGFAFQYDLTMIVRDLSDRSIYDLFHEKRRMALHPKLKRIIYRPVDWTCTDNGVHYRMNYMNRRFTICKRIGGTDKAPKFTTPTTVWDIFRFFRSRFITALLDWKIADKDHLEWMSSMKDKRGDFDKLSQTEVQRYCKDECLYLSKLCRAVIVAHKEAGLELKHYYGAGSTASVFLEKIDVKKYMQKPDEAMLDAVARAFIGGRFENTVVGPVQGPVWNYDISSAYPYQSTFLPCLIHGKWKHKGSPRIRDIENARLACVRWHIPPRLGKHQQVWGPFPVRADNGTIAFPLTGEGGWVWKDEFLVGCRMADVVAREAWLYHTDCNCQPFKDIPTYYLERIKLGKDARGIPMKLGTNSIYGKLAQSKGLAPPYQSWIWAGNITSGCRAQLLEAIVSCKEPWDLLMFATDGIWSRVPLDLPLPRDTGTTATGKPLGGWEKKNFPQGVFCVRPGIYFPLNPTQEEMDHVRARGLGKKILYDYASIITQAWKDEVEKLDIGNTCSPDGPCSFHRYGGSATQKCPQLIRFIGAKSGTSWGPKSGCKRSDDYGEWVPHTIQVSFNPMPKREKFSDDGRFLMPWLNFGWESVPYKSAMANPEAEMMRLAEDMAEEQPDLVFGDMN